jgi:hypothetical protein
MAHEDPAMTISTTVLSCAFVALTLALSVFRFLDGDEVEHLHSTWYVLNGALPYVDFFEHHHSLLWYCLAPLLALTGQSASAIIAFRLVFFALTLATVRATYLLALECGGSRAVARLAVTLLLSMTTFVYVAIEIRPDVPQVFFGVLSALYVVRLFRTRATRHAVYAGMAAALSFLFLQKAIFVLAAFPLLFLFHVIRRQLPWRAGLSFAVAFALTCMPFVGYLVATRSLDDYLVTNWFLNLNVGAGRARISVLSPVVVRDFARNALFWVLAICAAAAFIRRRFRDDYAVPACLGLWLVCVIFALNRVVDRYLAAAVPFLAVAVAAWFREEVERFRLSGRQAVAVLVLVCLAPGVAMVRSVGRSNAGQLAQIQYVLDNSRVDDRMYDEWRDFNLFRPDVHYFWFLAGPGVRIYGSLTGGRHSDYDTCRLIATVKPRFVSDHHAALERCGLLDQYHPTAFAYLSVRGDR